MRLPGIEPGLRINTMQPRGIEPRSPAWEAGILPFNYDCTLNGSFPP